MQTSRRHFAALPLVLALAGCATPSPTPPMPADGVIVETKKVIRTGSHIPANEPTSPIAHPEPTMAPLVILRAGESMPFMGPPGSGSGP